VPDVRASVKEMRRVVKPGGKLYFLEHTFADPSRPYFR
jgi:ubiquinone/menaquinone biosynthesis C-methylase UbiE